MKKFRIILLLAIVAALISLATAQNTKTHSSSGSSSTGSLNAATKPLTSKSAIALPRKSSTVVPKATTNTGAELAKLERQNSKGANAGKSSAQASKVPAMKPEGKPSANGSGINASYQKPKVARK